MHLLIFLTFVSTVFAWSPTGSYAPGTIQCPAQSRLTRRADSISPDEQAWLDGRTPVAQQNLITFLENANMEDFDASEFVSSAKKNITIGLAFSGGGYRAMLVGAGQLGALDSRNSGANEGGLGGLLQASTYLTGLSGGAWLVGTVALNNYISADNIIAQKSIWDITCSLLSPGGINIFKTMSYYAIINLGLAAKQLAGFMISITDIWGRALSYQMYLNYDKFGSSLTWSMISEQAQFNTYQMPYPIVVADGRTPGSIIIDQNSTIFEITPHELGSWDPSVNQFTKVKYLGTKVNNGYVQGGRCIGGFDNAGFIIGTSSSLFNEVMIKLKTAGATGLIQSLIDSFTNGFSKLDIDISVYKPNPFYGNTDGSSRSISNSDALYLVDGGEDNQNVPLLPLTRPERKVDVIFAYDNSADTGANWPDGASLVSTYQRQFSTQGQGAPFPYVPDINSFRNLDLTARPAFFGCDATKLSPLVSGSSDPVSNAVSNSSSPFGNFSAAATTYSTDPVYDVPLIVYTANRPFSYYSNTSTFKLQYTFDERNKMIQNGFETANRLNSTLDSEWAACVGCAIVRREQERQGVEQSDQCKKCFDRYCWNGDIDTSTPGDNFSLTGISVAGDSSIHPGTPNPVFK